MLITRATVTLVFVAVLFQSLSAMSEPLKIGLIGLPTTSGVREAGFRIAEHRAERLMTAFNIEVKIYARPDDCSESGALNAATDLLKQGVNALAGFLCPNTLNSVASMRLNIPLVVASSNAAWDKKAPAFRVVTRPDANEARTATFVLDTLRPESVLIVRGSETQQVSPWEDILSSAEIALEITGVADFHNHTESYDVFYFEGIGKSELELMDFFPNWAKRIDPHIFVDNSRYNAAWEWLDGHDIQFHYAEGVNPGMLPEFGAFAGGLATQWGLDPSPQVWSLGVGVDLIAAAAHKAGKIDSQEIIEILREGGIETLLGPLDFSEDGELKNDVTALYRRHGSHSDVLLGETFSCAPRDTRWNRPVDDDDDDEMQ